jgi:hypothetical protein
MNKNKKRQHRQVIVFLILIIALIIGTVYSFVQVYVKTKELEKLIFPKYEVNEVKHYQEIKQVNVREVTFTNYGTWDGESGLTTASGASIKDFEVNHKGWYTYLGDVVLATANVDRWDRELKQGYKAHRLGEPIEFELDGFTYTGVVLDVCGACMGVKSEDTQRYDIFTTKNTFGKTKGLILE